MNLSIKEVQMGCLYVHSPSLRLCVCPSPQLCTQDCWSDGPGSAVSHLPLPWPSEVGLILFPVSCGRKAKAQRRKPKVTSLRGEAKVTVRSDRARFRPSGCTESLYWGFLAVSIPCAWLGVYPAFNLLLLTKASFISWILIEWQLVPSFVLGIRIGCEHDRQGFCYPRVSVLVEECHNKQLDKSREDNCRMW